MNNLYLIGGSGSGKTTLAMTLENFFPEKFHRFLEMTTRESREGEIPGFDYEFISDEELKDLIKNDEVFESVQYQFGGSYYGGRSSNLVNDSRWNVIVASIEGILSGLTNTSSDDKSLILNIVIDDELDIQRENRSPNVEQNYNLAVLRNLFDENGNMNRILSSELDISYREIKLSRLKEIRDNKDELEKYFENI